MAPNEGRAESVEFKASTGWLEKFLRHNNLSLRRKTSVVPKDPDKLIAKLLSYIIHVRRVQEKQKYELAQIIAMDETPVWSEMVSATIIDATGKKAITVKSTDHENSRVLVCLANKFDGAKLKPMIAFRGTVRGCKVLYQEFRTQAWDSCKLSPLKSH